MVYSSFQPVLVVLIFIWGLYYLQKIVEVAKKLVVRKNPPGFNLQCSSHKQWFFHLVAAQISGLKITLSEKKRNYSWPWTSWLIMFKETASCRLMKVLVMMSTNILVHPSPLLRSKFISSISLVISSCSCSLNIVLVFSSAFLVVWRLTRVQHFHQMAVC